MPNLAILCHVLAIWLLGCLFAVGLQYKTDVKEWVGADYKCGSHCACLLPAAAFMQWFKPQYRTATVAALEQHTV